MKNNIQIKDMQAMNLIYCRHTGPFYFIGQAYEKLMKWAGPLGFLDVPDVKTVTFYHDDPKVTKMNQVHPGACITTDSNAKPAGKFGNMNYWLPPFLKCNFHIFSKTPANSSLLISSLTM